MIERIPLVFGIWNRKIKNMEEKCIFSDIRNKTVVIFNMTILLYYVIITR